LPLTAVLTWYCYDYLTPSNLCFAGNCMEAYEHGLSIWRYMTALAIQTPVTLFSFLYCNTDLCGRSKKPVLLATLAIAIAIGGIYGYFPNTSFCNGSGRRRADVRDDESDLVDEARIFARGEGLAQRSTAAAPHPDNRGLLQARTWR
jgi:hypothetical protein